MRFPDNFIEELSARSDIEAVISPYVRLRRRGRTLVGLCPFHGEKTPSFTVYPENNSFYCFGCGAGGSVFTFVQKIENLDFTDAVKLLAQRAGMRLPDIEEDDASARLRTRVLEANREAARLYHAALYAPEGKIALDYYHSRGYTDRTIKHFGLGWAPEGFHFLIDNLRQKGFRDEELQAAFLAKRSQRNGRLFDIFRGRVMIPIIDVRGNVIAFGGRVLDDSKPKYLNSSDTPVFKKTTQLFALNFAKATKERRLILCEGYMDVIAMHQAGFTNAVAALGTALTAENARLIARYADEVILIFDADAAGQKATQRSIGILRQTGIDIRVVTIPDGKDPDEFIRRNGAERFKLLLERSANDVEYRLMKLGQAYPLTTENGRVGYLRAAAQLLAELDSPVERDVYAGKLAQEMSVDKQSLLGQIRYYAEKRRQKKESPLVELVRQDGSTAKKANPEAERYPRAARAEEVLLGLLMINPDYIRSIADGLKPDDFVTPFNRALYEQLTGRALRGEAIDPALLAADQTPDGAAYITRMTIRARDHANSPEEAARMAQVIRQERRLVAAQNPSELSPEDMQKLLEQLKDQKS
ncbi:MAG: DNA primase [Acutalibacteraceae bacterium]|jgi:DNA primase